MSYFYFLDSEGRRDTLEKTLKDLRSCLYVCSLQCNVMSVRSLTYRKWEIPIETPVSPTILWDHCFPITPHDCCLILKATSRPHSRTCFTTSLVPSLISSSPSLIRLGSTTFTLRLVVMDGFCAQCTEAWRKSSVKHHHYAPKDACV